MLGLGKVKPVWLAEIGTRTAEAFDGTNWSSLPSLSRAKVEKAFSSIKESLLGQRLSTGVLLQQSVDPEESSLLVEQLEMMLSNSWIGRSGKQHPNAFSQMSAVCRIITKLQTFYFETH